MKGQQARCMTWNQPAAGSLSGHIRTVHTVIDHIYRRPEEDLSLEALSGIAGYSPFHFHRLFKAISGETMKRYALRIRLEKAARTLKEEGCSVTEAAFRYGFSSSANFTRSFSACFGFPPSQLLRSKPFAWESPFKGDISDGGGDKGPYPLTFQGLRKIEKTRVLSLSTISGYECKTIQSSYRSLIAAVSELGLFPPGAQLIGIGYDDPRITRSSSCRYDASVEIPFGLELPFLTHLPVREQLLPGRTYASFSFQGPPEAFLPAWEEVFFFISLRRDLVPLIEPHLEYYHPLAEGKGRMLTADLLVPVKRFFHQNRKN